MKKKRGENSKMKNYYIYDESEALEKAKEIVVRHYNRRCQYPLNKPTDRQWLKQGVSEPYSYGDERYRLDVFVLEGSPVKGFIIWNNARRVFLAFSVSCGLLAAVHA